METINYIKIRELAGHFRNAIEKCPKERLSVSFCNFPRGACGDTSILLGEFLSDHGYGPCDYVSGIRDHQSHAWLELNKMIIDITADQFDEKESKVILTNDRTWHSTFIEEMRHQANIDIWDEKTRIVLWQAYNLIISFL